MVNHVLVVRHHRSGLIEIESLLKDLVYQINGGEGIVETRLSTEEPQRRARIQHDPGPDGGNKKTSEDPFGSSSENPFGPQPNRKKAADPFSGK